MSFLKGTKVYSIFTGKCPVCHNQSMYKESNPYRVSSILQMHERCSHCNTKYKIEPSFFYGAMYVSYGVGIAFAAVAFAITYFIMQATPLKAFVAIVVTLVIFMPVIMRISRNIWINLFMKYDRNQDAFAKR